MANKGRTRLEKLKGAFLSPVSAAILKATDSSRSAQKKKHLTVIANFSLEPYSDVDFIIGKLTQRATTGSAVNFIKSVATFHYLLRRGPLRLLQAAATNAHALPPPPSSQDAGSAAMPLVLAGSTTAYLRQRVSAYRILGFDAPVESRWEKSHRWEFDAQNGSFKRDTKILAMTLSLMESLLCCLDHDAPPGLASALPSDELIKFQVELLREDLFQLLRPAVEGVSVISGIFLSMNKQSATGALKLLTRFAAVCERIDAVVATYSAVGAMKTPEHPFAEMPNSLLPMFRQHLRNYFQRVSSQKSASTSGAEEGPSTTAARRRISSAREPTSFKMDTLEAQATPYRPIVGAVPRAPGPPAEALKQKKAAAQQVASLPETSASAVHLPSFGESEGDNEDMFMEDTQGVSTLQGAFGEEEEA